MTNPKYLTDHEVAERLGVSRRTIHRWRAAGEFPKAAKLGPKCTKWRETDIQAWEDTRVMCFAA